MLAEAEEGVEEEAAAEDINQTLSKLHRSLNVLEEHRIRALVQEPRPRTLEAAAVAVVEAVVEAVVVGQVPPLLVRAQLQQAPVV